MGSRLSSQRLATTALVVLGLGAVSAGIVLNLPNKWLRLACVLAGVIALFASPPASRRLWRAMLDRSRVESPATRGMLRRRPALYLLYALWFALVSSLAEGAFWTYKKLTLNSVIGFQYTWLLPMGYLMIFGVLGVAFVLMARRWLDRLAPVFFFSCVFVSFAGLLFLVEGLHAAAAAVLAAGVAAQITRLSAGHDYLVFQLVRRTLPALALVVLVVAAAFWAWPRWAEQRAISRLPPVSIERPNVLFVVLDTVRAKSLSLYGYSRATSPNLDRFAARGVVFEHALSTSPWTLPSHGSMFTGRFPHQLSGDWTAPIDATHRTVAEILQAHGYLTAGFVANLTYCGSEFGLGRGFIHYEDHNTSAYRAFVTSSFGRVLVQKLKLQDRFATHDNFGQKSAEQINRDFLAWLAVRERGRPYFAFLNYYDAHAGYVSPDEFARKFSAKRPRGDIWSRRLDAWSPAEIRELNDAYDGTVAYVDDQLGRLFEALERRGELKDTVVVITSDHGEQFGEHNLLEHANSLYLPLLHVPLVVVDPSRARAGHRVDAQVSLRELPATIVDLTHLTDVAGFPGASLTRYWDAPDRPSTAADRILLAEVGQAYPAYPDSYPARKGRMATVFFNGMQYIRNYGNGREELYDLRRDRETTNDLFAGDPHAVETFRGYLQEALQQAAAERR